MAAYFQFEQDAPDGAAKTFIFKLIDAARIDEARKIISEKSGLHVQGNVITSARSYNPGWSFHLDPNTIKFFEMAIEVCDANVTYVEDHLDEVGGAFLPGSHWCPWSSKLAREVTDQIDPKTEQLVKS